MTIEENLLDLATKILKIPQAAVEKCRQEVMEFERQKVEKRRQEPFNQVFQVLRKTSKQVCQ